MMVETIPATSSSRGASKRYAAYTLAAGAAACVSTSQADAAIVYSGPQNLSIGQGFFQNLNLDGDGFNDISLKNYVLGGGNYQGATVLGSPGKPVGFNNGLAYISALGAGSSIGASALSPSFFGSMSYGALNPAGQFNNVTNAFIGLGFPIGGVNRFGWIRVDVNNAAGTFLVKDWAYDTTAGQSILAGDTGSGIIPEPSTLALLAAGAFGVAAIRRKRAS